MSVVSISAPQDLIHTVDDVAGREGYSGRSELVRAALREFLQTLEDESRQEGTRSATITLAYDEDATDRVARVKHEFADITTSMLHSHTDDGCLEVLIVQGNGDAVRRLANGLRGIRSVDRFNLFYVG